MEHISLIISKINTGVCVCVCVCVCVWFVPVPENVKAIV